MSARANIRLYVDHPLAEGTRVSVTQDQAHYLNSVMRLRAGAELSLFNGKDGEYEARVERISKREATLQVLSQSRPLQRPPDLWLLFAPIKKARTDFIVEKAAELGAARICPVQTDYTNSERIRRERLQAHAIEAAEQCGGTFVPEVADFTPLARILRDWPSDRHLLFSDEALVGQPSSFKDIPTAEKWAVLIGPEGGFSEAERNTLKAMPQVTSVSLGPRVLRADTAAVAALTLFQSHLGDWR